MNVDPSLLDLLPPTIEDVALESSADASREVAADPALSGDAEAVAYAIAASRESRDLLVVAVARIRPGTFTDDFFRGWRDSYDAEVCGQAGGVLGHAEAEIDARQVFIGTCVNDGRTYHTWLNDQRVIVSAFSVGQRRMGERLMESLDP